MLGIRRGAVAGLLAAGTALGVGQFVAGLTGASGSPVVAVGELQIDFTPPWLKNFAISTFGANDKLALISDRETFTYREWNGRANRAGRRCV